MNEDPIVTEVRRLRQALWREAGGDLNGLAELVRREAALVAHGGPALAGAEELRRYAEQQSTAAPALREEPPEYGGKSGQP